MVLNMNKKGTLFDGVVAVFWVFVIAICCIAMLFASTLFNEQISQDPQMTDYTKQVVAEYDNNLAWIYDFLCVILLISLPMGAAILAFVNDIPPFLFVIVAILNGITIIMGSIFSDSWNEMISHDATAAIAARIPITNYIIQNFGLYATFVVMVILFGVYVKIRNTA